VKEMLQKVPQKITNAAVLSKSMIYKSLATFHATGAVPDKKKTNERHILTIQKLNKTAAHLEASPKVTKPISSSMQNVKLWRILSNKTA
jgi:hypothetical protein